MHGLRPARAGRGDIRSHIDTLEAAAVQRPGIRNIFGPVPHGSGFSADGLLGAPNSEIEIQGMLRRLSNRLLGSHDRLWPDRLPGASETWENPSLPSGYTYLLQLMAHDVVASSLSLAIDGDAREFVENLRSRPLMLDTIYGGGPEVTPQAYSLCAANRDSHGLIPRTRLRVGPLRLPEGGQNPKTKACPFRDIGRAKPTDTDDPGLDLPARKQWRTEALLADPRNDAHALVSQLTVVFQLLHNRLMTILEARSVCVANCSDTEIAFRRFQCARLVTTMIYRNIIQSDVLNRILETRVYHAYVKRSGGRPAIRLDKGAGVALEFSYGAFRFGHAMVRDDYQVNSPAVLPTIRALDLSSIRTPGFLPVTDDWFVDWALFFEVDAALTPNASRRIGPDYPAVLQDSTVFPPFDSQDAVGLAFRDHQSAAYAGLWSAPKLCSTLSERLKPHGLDALVPSFDVWRGPLRAWLGDSAGGSEFLEKLTAADIERLTNDPPLSFFIAFEAAHVMTSGNPALAGGGQRLGAVGSILVAEAILGALDSHRIEFESRGTTLTERIAACSSALLSDSLALTELTVEREIDTMPDLIKVLIAKGDFPPASPV